MGTLCIGYDVESDNRKITRKFLDQVTRIHGLRDVPCTFFIKGRTLARNKNNFRRISRNLLFDLEQHTYSHLIFKRIEIFDGKKLTSVGNDEPAWRIREEIKKTNDLFRDVLGFEPIGLTTPYAFHGGLGDRPDILAVLEEEGIRFVRSWGRNEHGYNPVPLEVQPFFYSEQGFPSILECPVQGWQDCIWRDKFGWTAPWEKQVQELIDQACHGGLYLGLVQHDWSSIREDAGMSRTAAILDHALEKGMRILHYKDYYLETCKNDGIDPRIREVA